MKGFIFIMSVICAAALGLLSYIFATGRIPMRAVPAAAAPSSAEIEEAMPFKEREVVAELIASLRAERDAFVARREALETSATRQALESKLALLEALKNELQVMQFELESKIEAARQLSEETASVEEANLRNLADVYSKMEPENAAEILRKMDVARAATMLSMMTDRQAAAIMDAVAQLGDEARKLAVEWAEFIRKMRKSP